jgi:hypothetical protein
MSALQEHIAWEWVMFNRAVTCRLLLLVWPLSWTEVLTFTGELIITSAATALCYPLCLTCCVMCDRTVSCLTVLCRV